MPLAQGESANGSSESSAKKRVQKAVFWASEPQSLPLLNLSRGTAAAACSRDVIPSTPQMTSLCEMK